MLKIDFSTDNDAFCEAPATETARILRKTARLIELGELEGPVFDVNGNKIGSYTLDNE